jgi:hypothetical protein
MGSQWEAKRIADEENPGKERVLPAFTTIQLRKEVPVEAPAEPAPAEPAPPTTRMEYPDRNKILWPAGEAGLFALSILEHYLAEARSLRWIERNDPDLVNPEQIGDSGLERYKQDHILAGKRGLAISVMKNEMGAFLRIQQWDIREEQDAYGNQINIGATLKCYRFIKRLRILLDKGIRATEKAERLLYKEARRIEQREQATKAAAATA